MSNIIIEALNDKIESWSVEKQVRVTKTLIECCKHGINEKSKYGVLHDSDSFDCKTLLALYEAQLNEALKVGHG